MDALYNLKDKLCKELKEYGDKELSAGSLSTIDSLAHTIKNLDKIIEKYEGESYGYSMNYGQNSMNYGGSYGERNLGGMSGAGRRGARRDSMGRYSRGGGDMVSELRELMQEAPENMRGEFQKLISKVEYM